jgi:hypothetical protein
MVGSLYIRRGWIFDGYQVVVHGNEVKSAGRRFADGDCRGHYKALLSLAVKVSRCRRSERFGHRGLKLKVRFFKNKSLFICGQLVVVQMEPRVACKTWRRGGIV